MEGEREGGKIREEIVEREKSGRQEKERGKVEERGESGRRERKEENIGREKKVDKMRGRKRKR